MTELTPDNPLWDLYIKFHTGQIKEPYSRMEAKILLHSIHYGNVDVSKAEVEISRIMDELYD